MPGAKMSTRAIRAAKAREPQVVEGDKRLLALKGPSTSALAVEALTDLVRRGGADAGGARRPQVPHRGHPPSARGNDKGVAVMPRAGAGRCDPSLAR
jgi:hypothetical protein